MYVSAAWWTCGLINDTYRMNSQEMPDVEQHLPMYAHMAYMRARPC
jgi:hypothetical protein